MTDSTARTRRLLTEIPNLATRITHSITSTNDDSGAKKLPPISKPPLNVDHLDLIDGREIANWVRLAYDTMTDLHQDWPGPADWNNLTNCCQWLAVHTDWIIEQFPDPEPIKSTLTECPTRCPDGHRLTAARLRTINGVLVCQWCPTGFATAIRQLHGAYRRAAGDIPGPKLSCLKCGNRAYIDGIWLLCTEVDEHARTVEDIEHEWRFRPALPADQIAAEFGLTVDKLRDWKRRGRLHAAGTQGRANTYWPWDVFCLLNPSVAEAINARDTVKESA